MKSSTINKVPLLVFAFAGCVHGVVTVTDVPEAHRATLEKTNQIYEEFVSCHDKARNNTVRFNEECAGMFAGETIVVEVEKIDTLDANDNVALLAHFPVRDTAALGCALALPEGAAARERAMKKYAALGAGDVLAIIPDGAALHSRRVVNIDMGESVPVPHSYQTTVFPSCKVVDRLRVGPRRRTAKLQ